MVVERHPRYAARFEMSICLAFGNCALAVMYLFPGLLAPANPTTTRIVTELARVSPIWTVWFGSTGIALIVALCTHKLLHVAHAATGSSWIGFCFVLELSAIANHGTHILPLAAALLGAVNIIVAASYSRDVRRREAQ
jgi:hypothetical protein